MWSIAEFKSIELAYRVGDLHYSLPREPASPAWLRNTKELVDKFYYMTSKHLMNGLMTLYADAPIIDK